jgi:hypothetical protein
VVYRETADPILTEHINWHLNPRLDWSNFAEQFDSDLLKNDQKIADDLKKLAVFEFNTQNNWTASEIALIVIGVIFALLTMAYIVRNYVTRRIRLRRIPETKDDVEMEPMQPETTHHHIVIQG